MAALGWGESLCTCLLLSPANTLTADTPRVATGAATPLRVIW